MNRSALPPVVSRMGARALALLLGGAIVMSGPAVAAAPATAAAALAPSTTVAAKLTPGSTITGAALAIPPAPTTGVIPTNTLVARSLVRKISVYSTPFDKKPALVMDNRTNFSGVHVFIVIGKQDGWLKVLVPVRPNGRTGWIRMADVGVYQHDYAIVVSLKAHSLTLYQAGQPLMTETVAVGQSKYPTPLGMFFIRELARPGNPRGAYGPYAFGLSAYSNVLTSFGAGNGQVGIHGTNRPDQLGTDASHGCIRMSNTAVTALAKRLPQGVPVDIRA